MYYNSIRLLKGTCEKKNYKEGDAIYGIDSDPDILAVYPDSDLDQALMDFEKYKFTDYSGNLIIEYALEFCDLDDNGEFISGSDFILSE